MTFTAPKGPPVTPGERIRAAVSCMLAGLDGVLEDNGSYQIPAAQLGMLLLEEEAEAIFQVGGHWLKIRVGLRLEQIDELEEGELEEAHQAEEAD